MPKFKVKDTDILYNGKLYKEGKTIEVKENEAKKLACYLEPLPEVKKDTKKQPENKSQEQKNDNNNEDNK